MLMPIKTTCQSFSTDRVRTRGLDERFSNSKTCVTVLHLCYLFLSRIERFEIRFLMRMSLESKSKRSTIHTVSKPTMRAVCTQTYSDHHKEAGQACPCLPTHHQFIRVTTMHPTTTIQPKPRHLTLNPALVLSKGSSPDTSDTALTLLTVSTEN